MDIKYIRGQIDEIILTADEVEQLREGEVVLKDGIKIYLEKPDR